MSQVETIRWGLYCAKVVAASILIVFGMGSHQDTDWTSKYSLYILLYVLWVAMTLGLVLLMVERTTEFVGLALLCVFSTILTFYFVFGILKEESDTLPIFIPICVDMGILLGILIQHTLSCVSQLCKQCRDAVILALQNWLANPERFGRRDSLPT